MRGVSPDCLTPIVIFELIFPYNFQMALRSCRFKTDIFAMTCGRWDGSHSKIYYMHEDLIRALDLPVCERVELLLKSRRCSADYLHWLLDPRTQSVTWYQIYYRKIRGYKKFTSQSRWETRELHTSRESLNYLEGKRQSMDHDIWEEAEGRPELSAERKSLLPCRSLARIDEWNPRRNCKRTWDRKVLWFA